MYVTKVNSRKFIDYLLTDYMQLNTVQTSTLMKLIDRMNKTESAVFSAAVDAIFSPSARENGLPDQLLKLLKTTSIGDLPLPLRSHESISEIEQLIQLLKNDGISNVEFDSSLMRGFDYYTDIVFEVFDRDPTNNRSMFGGGRYDGLLKLFGVEPIPTVGLGMGDVTLQNFLETHGLLPKIRSETDAYVILIGDIYTKAHDALNDLRNMGLKIAVDMTDRKIATKIKAAVKKDIRYVIFIGEQELATQQYVMRDLETGEEEKHSPARMVSLIKDRRNK
jgi:histidyl-tRNA synthetase